MGKTKNIVLAVLLVAGAAITVTDGLKCMGLSQALQYTFNLGFLFLLVPAIVHSFLTDREEESRRR